MFIRPLALVSLALLLATQTLHAQETEAKATDAIATGPKATLENVKWIAGRWTGEAMGGKFEETWNPPSANSMLGMFKFIKDDSVGFYEILTIVPDGESLKLRLKHFSDDLNGWEEKDKSVEFPLVSISETEAKFDGLVFMKISMKEMHIIVDIKQGDKTNKTKFVCLRSWFNPKTSTAIDPKAKANENPAKASSGEDDK